MKAPSIPEYSRRPSSALLWAVFVAFAAGLVLGGQIANLNHRDPVAEARDEDELPASSFVAADARLRQTIIDLRQKEKVDSKL